MIFPDICQTTSCPKGKEFQDIPPVSKNKNYLVTWRFSELFVSIKPQIISKSEGFPVSSDVSFTLFFVCQSHIVQRYPWNVLAMWSILFSNFNHISHSFLALFVEKFVKDLDNFNFVYPQLALYEYPDFKTFSWRNSKELPDKFFVKLRFGGKRHILELKKNKHLVNPNFNSEDDKSHKILEDDNKHLSRDCYYTGSVLKQRKSLAAISTCNGLVRKVLCFRFFILTSSSYMKHSLRTHCMFCFYSSPWVSCFLTSPTVKSGGNPEGKIISQICVSWYVFL